MSEIVKQSFEDLIQDINKNPEKATANFEATALLKEKLTVKGNTRQFNFEFDEPEILGGEDAAPNPVEYVLATLGECQAITYKALASLKGIQLDKVTITTKGDLDLQGFLGLNSTVRPGFQNVAFETHIETNADPDTILRLSKQVESLCPVLDIISNPVEVKSTLTIKN
ncbi:OsmC family protein [Arenibacter certesii]|uniref:OsmC family peroxiredoxin n=1 Tax=Arenibacter certesii TaxID=228955 RepID=A0A918J7T0_9FLAO|nr:OsmC family protein [Arenibacter certesii]GGW49660.1 hypothetical protein GCM10007383_36920 [Arenibacter certesii]